MTNELALTPEASAAATGAVVREATRTLVVTGPNLPAMLDKISADMEIVPLTVVDSDDMAVELMDMLGRISTVSAAMEAERKERKKPLLETGQWLDAGYNPMIATLTKLIEDGKAKLTVYNRAKQEAKRKADAEAAEQRRKDAEEAARKEAEAVTAAAATLAAATVLREAGSEQVANAMESDAMVAVDTARQEAATAVRQVYSAPARAATPAVKGASVKWSAEVTDKAKLIVMIGQQIAAGNLANLNLLDVSTANLNALARLQKENLRLDGVRPVSDDKLAIRKQAVAA